MDGGSKDDSRLEQDKGRTAAAPVIVPIDTSKPAPRFAFVDGLRGLASISIVLHHIWWYEPMPYPALESVHWTVDQLLFRIRGAVQILLVVSGFVIAYTLRKTWFTQAEVVSFIGRRLVRLVPTYWVTIAIVLIVDAACRGWDLRPPFDDENSPARTIAHMTFLQEVLSHESLSAGMWTLCIEMQFYIVAILGWGIAQRLFPRPVSNEPRPSVLGLLLVFAPFAIVSLFHWRTLESTSPFVTHFLWMFFLGMAAWWTLDSTLPQPAFGTIAAIAIVNLVVDVRWRYENSIALITALAIFLAGRQQRLHVWLNWAPLQYLGRISYSLYLIHFPVCHLLTTAGWKWCDDEPSKFQARLILLCAIPASLLAGHVLYMLVEAPSARWAARMKRVVI